MKPAIPSESIRRRFGCVHVAKPITDQVIDRTSSNAQAAWNALMSDFVIVHIEECRMTGSIRYTGYHPNFDEVPENAEAFTPKIHEVIFKTTTEDHNITTVEAVFVGRK